MKFLVRNMSDSGLRHLQLKMTLLTEVMDDDVLNLLNELGHIYNSCGLRIFHSLGNEGHIPAPNLQVVPEPENETSGRISPSRYVCRLVPRTDWKFPC